jgi:peptide/nickel transport system substrate-binding protein
MKYSSLGLPLLLAIIMVLMGCSAPASTTAKPVAPTTSTAPVTPGQVPGIPVAPSSSAAPAAPPTTANSPASSPVALTPKSGGIFKFIDVRNPSTTMGWWAEPGNLPTMGTVPVLETLLNYDYAHNPTPKLATSWTIAQDLSSVTFNLRKGVKFHDGSDWNADVAKWNFDQYFANKVGVVANWSSVDKVDDYTIRINVKKWENNILDDIENNMFMVSKQTFDAKGKDFLRWNPVGTGPFKFASWERDVNIKFTKFNDYWQKGKPYLDGIELYFVQDPMTMAASLKSGSVDAVGRDLARPEYDLVQSGYPLVSCYTGVVTLIPDSKNADSPYSKLKVRQAIEYGVDRENLVKTLGLGFQCVTYQYSVPGASSYMADLPAHPYNLDKAKQLLAEAGYPNGFESRLVAQNISTDKEEMTAVQGYLNKLGIKATLEWVDSATYDKARIGGWKNGLLCNAMVVSPNGGVWATTIFGQTAAYYPSMDKTNDSAALLSAVKSSREYDPALMKKFNQYIYDTTMVNPLFGTSRGHIMQKYVKDTGMYAGSGWTKWSPENAWLNK